MKPIYLYQCFFRNQQERITTGFNTNVAENKIGYTFRQGSNQRLYWSLPADFTGNKIKSYGGRIEFTQHYTTNRYNSNYSPDQDVIIIGNGVTIYWTNPISQLATRDNVS